MRDTRPQAPLLAWLGGGLFVGSLGFFIWSYFVQFGQPSTGSSTAVAVAADVALFTAFALHHSLFARSGVKRWVITHIPAHLERSVYVWIASLLFIGVCAAWQQVPGVLYRRAGLAVLPHWIAVGLGLWLIARSAAVLDPLDLAGIRQAQRTPTPDAFRVVGPYRWLRHPIYLGWILVVFGVPHMTATHLTFAIVSTAYLIAAIPVEERSLRQVFGDIYERYQRDVRWRLIPWVW